MLNLWWAVWIIGSFVQNFAVRLWFDAETTSGLRSSDRADIAGLVLDIIAAALAIVIVRRLTARQTERASRFRHDPVAVVSHPL